MSNIKEESAIVSLLRNGEDIVISGIAGRFPESDSTDEFAENLFNNIDMITEDDRRWPTDLYDMNHRMGKLKTIEKFDGFFFGSLGNFAHTIDPHSRILLETAYETICDAGINPDTLRGTNTGVYIGYTSLAVCDNIPQEPQEERLVSGADNLWLNGTAKAMYSNRISFLLDFHGPSITIDTACSSSMVAFDVAVTDLRLGKIDTAIVGGTQICLTPYTNHTLQMLGVNASDGISKIWDENADGYVRGETVSCVLLQRKSVAKRIYATVIHSRTNIDGYKIAGMFYPSTEGQRALMERVYKEANVNPNDVNYFEAHGTGTKVGDPQEARAITQTYCENRTEPLPIGLLKSNIGHGEAASGVASIVKVLISFENKCIPANLNLKELKKEIAKFSPLLFPVTKNLPYKSGIAGVNSFGVGGVNGHALLKSHDKEITAESYKIVNEIPRLINVCGRTNEGLNYIFDFIEKNPKKITREFLALLGDAMKIGKIQHLKATGFPYRGSMIINEITRNDGSIGYEYTRQSSMLGDKRPVWFFFSGMGSQWIGMGKSLMSIDIFAKSINKSAEIIKEFNINLLDIILGNDENALNTITPAFVSITAIQIAMFDVLNKLNIHADGIIGHSFGENACAYADGCLTHEQTLLISYWRGIETGKKSAAGVMASVGLSWDEAKRKVPKGVTVACNNSPKNVTISGTSKETTDFMETLKSQNIFVREVNCYGFSYHSHHMNQFSKNLLERLKKIIPSPKERSCKWISSSVPESKWDNDDAKFASAEYFVNNLVNPVLFNSALVKHVPSEALIVEIAPHALFANLIKQSLEDATYIGMSQKHKNDTNLHTFLLSIGKLYENGVNVAIEHLYPKVIWPVPKATQSIGSLIKWNHKESFYVKKYPEYHFHSTASDMIFNFDLTNPDHLYLTDHKIENRIIFPGSGYLMLAWKRLAAAKGKNWSKVPVVFENVQIQRPTLFSDNGTAKLTVRYIDGTGEFEILESGNVACFGRIYSPQDECLQLQHLLDDENYEQNNNEKTKLSQISTIESYDIYKELRIRGHDYGPKFQGIVETDFSDLRNLKSKVKWEQNWIAFVDSVFQIPQIAFPFRSMLVPVCFTSFRCDPKVLFEAIDEYEISDTIEETAVDESINEHVTPKLTAMERKTEIVESIYENFPQFNAKKKENKKVSILPAVFDMHRSTVISKGVEVRNVMPALIQRRPLTKEMKLERHEFIAHNDTHAIEGYLKLEINDYIHVCSALALKTLRFIGINAESIMNDTKDNTKVNYDPIKYSKNDYILYNIFCMINENFKEKQNDYENISQMLKEFMVKENMDPSKDILNNICINERLIRPMIDIVNENNTKRELKVLEINVNDQIMAKEIEEMLSLTFVTPVIVEYTIMTKDVDQYNDDINMNRFKFIEYDHKTLFPNDISSLDLIIHRDSIDIWEYDLTLYLQSVYDSLKNSGFFLILFRSKITSPELAFHYLYENKHLKDINMNHRIEEFEKISKSLGFEVINRKSDSILYNAILFRKINKNIDPQKQTIVNLEICKYNVWVETLKDKVKEHKEKNENENIWIIANDSPINGVLGLITCLRQEPGGDRIRCIFDPQSKLPSQIDFSEKIFYDILIKDLAFNVFCNDKFGTFRHLSLPKNYDKIETRDAHLNASQRGDLSSLQWFDSTHIKLPKVMISDGKAMEMVRCDVYYSALNFKDVMIASGRLMSGPEAEFLDCLIGFEFAGRRCDNGQRVYGLSMGGAIATSLVTNSRLLFNIPDKWTMEDASTILSVYFTVWYGLMNRGAMQEGESVLIHSGAGGIGQSAIMVCQYYNCNIFTTVGTEEKRNFLKEKYNIPDDHIFSSRDTAFEEKIFAVTKGRGVDIVLNSLTDDKFHASFRCLNYDGRFVELGKYDFQMNHKLNTLLFLKNISFHGVGVDRVLMTGFETKRFITIMQMFSQWIDDGVKFGYVKPINRTVFPINKTEDAFRYMLTGKHIGKLVIKIRDEESDKSITNAKPVNVIATTKTWFDPEKVYIIIGGLGGMGLELLHWIQRKGAKNIVLSSRSGIKTNYQRLILKRFNEYLEMDLNNFYTNIKVLALNVTTVEETNQLIEESESMGPIGGIFNLAVVLNDGLFTDQTVESFQETCEPKVNVTVNLDKITRERCPQLDYFVVFSSVSCGRGNAGQTNYGYANSVMERICEQRRNDGIHGLAIQWGPIGDVGVASDEYDEKIKMAGLVKQRINVCMHVLEKFLQCPYSIVSSMVRAERQISGSSIEDKMMNNLWQSLGVDPEITPNHLSLGELGIESFVAVELQNRIEREYETTISLSDVKRITVGDLKDFQKGNKEKVKETIVEIKKSRAKISKLKFIIPFENVTKLNDIQKGKPLYFMPPVEGIFDIFKDLAKLLKRPVYGLNWTRETNGLKDIKQIAMYYMKILKDLEPKGEYDLMGYSFGAVVAIQMLFKRAPINDLIIIDTFSSTQLSDDLDDDEYFQLFFKSLKNIPESYRIKLSKEILSLKDENEKIKKITHEFKDFGEKSINGKDFDDIIHGSYKRGKMLIDFKRKMMTKNKIKIKIAKSLNKFMGINNKVNVIKIVEDANDAKSIQNNITETYGISPEDLENKYNLEIIIGNPDDDENFGIISESINKLL